MRVRVDAAGAHVLPARIDYPVGLDVERFTDLRDRLAFDEDVRDAILVGGDDASTLDQNGHPASLARKGHCRGRASPAPTGIVRLFAAGRHLDGRCLPAGAVHVYSFGLEVCNGRVRIVGDVRPVARLGLDDLVVDRDLARGREVVRVHDPDPEVVGPDELVDLVQLPALVTLAQSGAVVEHDLEAFVRVV